MGAYLTGELAAHNETYGLVSSVFSLLKNRQPSDQKYEQTILGAAKKERRFAPHPQCLPPLDSD